MTQLALIGRADELELARGMLRRARDGTPGVLLVGGEAGVGRSRLAAAIADEAVASGARAATGTCVRMDAGALTYAAIITALRSLAATADPAEVARTLGTHRHQVARLLPEVARPVPDSPPLDEDPMARLRLFEAVTGWLNRMADGDPVLLIVEDLQWADAATLDLLRALALGLTGRTALVVTLRTDEVLPQAVRATLAELVRDGAERVELVPFGRDELAGLAAEVRGAAASEVDEAALDILLERTGGNPFLARELIDAGLLEPGAPEGVVPTSLRDILDARLGALDEPVLEVLRAAAMQPGPIDDDLLAAVLGRPVGMVGAALREARESGVLTATGGAHAFRHAMQAEVLVDQLGSGERRALHAAYADALAGTRGPARATAAAWHRDAAGDPAAALAAHVAAADATMTAAAFEAASRHAERAAELRAVLGPEAESGMPDRITLLDRAAFAALLAGDPAASVRLARAALEAVGDDPVRGAALHDRLRWALWEAGDRAGAASEVERAVGALGDGADPHLRARLTAQRAAMRMDDADPGPALALADEALGLALAIGAQDAEALALGVRGRTLATHGDLDAGLADLRAGIELADAMDNLHGRLVGVATVATILARWGRSREALADIDGAIAAADAAGLARSLGAPLLAQAARASFSVGDWDAAEQRAAAGLARRPAAPSRPSCVRSRSDSPSPGAGRRRQRHWTHGWRSSRRPSATRRARRRFASPEPRQRSRPGARGRPGRCSTPSSPHAKPGSSRGRPPRGWRPWRSAQPWRSRSTRGPRGTRTPRPMPSVASRSTWRSCARRPRTPEDAGARSPTPFSPTSRPRRPGSTGTPAGEWRPGPPPRAGGTRSTGRTTPRSPATGSPKRAWPTGSRGPRSATRCGPRPQRHGGSAPHPCWTGSGASRAWRESSCTRRTTRAPRAARRSTRAGAEAADPLATLGLTPREREILRRVAAGWSNARIAGDLGISVSTASVHVSNILAKLDVENRVEAAALAHRLGVVAADPDEPDEPDATRSGRASG